MYDVIGSGEGIASLLACTLLSAKGLVCLHIDNTPDKPGSSLWPDSLIPMTSSFLKGVMEPLVISLSPYLLKSLKSRSLPIKRRVLSETIVPLEGPEYITGKGISKKYLSFVRRSLARPEWLWWGLKGKPSGKYPVQDTPAGAFGTMNAGRVSHLQSLASRHGMCALEHAGLKNLLVECLVKNNGAYLNDPDTELIMYKSEPLGQKLDGSFYKANRYIADLPRNDDAQGEGS